MKTKVKATFNLSLIGTGGDGIMATASMILQTAAKKGLYGMMTQSYGPQIRGGESAAHVTIGRDPVATVDREKEIVVCFRFADAARFTKEIRLSPGAVVFHGVEEKGLPEFFQGEKVTAVPVPFVETLAKNELPEIAKNVFVMGILMRAMGWDLEAGKQCLQETFARKSSAVISSNIRALELGYACIENLKLPFTSPQPKEARSHEVMTGNKACAHGAIGAGCRFYAGYPITPSTEILEEMGELLPAVGGKIIQSEDEIAALGMVVGASYGGVPSMTATSGPGLSLMTEMMGLASSVEIPIVIVDCQRGGPSTGLPSRTEQSDLFHALYGGHGDFPRVVLAPTDVRDCYRTMYRAFYVAETWQMPVLVLSDGTIAQRSEVIDVVDASDFPRAARRLAEPGEGKYLRFTIPVDDPPEFMGVSPMAIPGTARGEHTIAGIAHTDRGTMTSDGDMHHAMNQKRFTKLNSLAWATEGWYRIFGKHDAPHLLIAWGSTAGVAHEIVHRRNDVALFVPEILNPFPKKALQSFLAKRASVAVVEMNFQGQLHHHLRAIGVIDDRVLSIHRSGGLPFHVDELAVLLEQGGAL